jgi:hypothetical protein
MTSEKRSDQEIVEAYVRYQTGVGNMGDQSDWWAIEELNDLAIDDPERTWKIIQMINKTPVADGQWRSAMLAVVGCGPLEEIIALHPDTILPQILAAAEKDEILRTELSVIYESSFKPEIWARIQDAIGRKKK